MEYLIDNFFADILFIFRSGLRNISYSANVTRGSPNTRNNLEYFNTILMYKKGRNIKAKEKRELSTRAVGGFYFTAQPITQVFVFLSYPPTFRPKVKKISDFFPIRLCSCEMEKMILSEKSFVV